MTYITTILQWNLVLPLPPPRNLRRCAKFVNARTSAGARNSCTSLAFTESENLPRKHHASTAGVEGYNLVKTGAQ